MSIAIEFANGKGGCMGGEQVATNSGWFEFGTWIDSLPVDSGYNTLIHLWEYGYSYHVEDLGKELRKAAQGGRKPSKYVREVGEDLLILIKRHVPLVKKSPKYDAIMVSDGC